MRLRLGICLVKSVAIGLGVGLIVRFLPQAWAVAFLCLLSTITLVIMWRNFRQLRKLGEQSRDDLLVIHAVVKLSDEELAKRFED